MGLERDPAWIRFLPVSVRPYLAGRNNLHAAVHNSGWLLFDKLVRLMLGLLVGAWVARYLGPAQYGELAYALAYIAFFQTVSTLGLDSIVVRDLVIHPEREAQVLGTAFTLRFACGIFSWLVAVLGMAVISGWSDRSVLLVLLAGGSLVFQAADTVDLWFQSRSQSRRTVVAKLAAYLLSGGVKVALIVAEAPLAAFAAVLAFEAMSAALGLFFSYRRFRCSQPWRLVWVQGRQLLDESWPFILSGLSIMAYIRIDQIMIKEMLGERALGIYAVILPLSTFWQIIPTTFSVSLAPFIAKQRLADEAQYRKTIVLVFRAFFYLGVFVALSTYFVSGSFLRKTSLDELPQLWSILRGDMSFVGPRPALFNQHDLIGLRAQAGVDKLLPGLTGWAQVNGRDELSIADKVALDVEYLQKKSLAFDVKIMILTVFRVLSRDNVTH